MAQLAVLGVALVGAGIGLGVGAAVGLTTFAALATAASIGFSIGMLAGNALFPEKIKQEGSRLNDLAVSSSTFGAVRPVVYGRVRIGGNVIWSKPIEEVRTTVKHGKGGPSVTSTTYTYYGTFAIALAEGPIDQVTRIWADSKLIFDSSNPDPYGDIFPRASRFVQQQILAAKVNFRFYPGSEDQLPDSIIQADKGAANVPAYRGTCYLVFDKLPLADYGNRLPNITCEVVQKAAPAYPYQIWAPKNPDTIFGPDTAGHFTVAVDWNRNLVYWQGQNPLGIVVADAVTLRTIREKPMTEVLVDGTDGAGPYGTGILGNVDPGISVGPDGALYFVVSGRHVRVDQNTLKETASFPTGTWVDFSTEHFGQPTAHTFLRAFAPGGERLDFLLAFNFFGNWGALALPGMTYEIHGEAPVHPGPCNGAVQGKVGQGYGDAWAMWGPNAFSFGTTLGIQRIRYSAGAWSTVGFTINVHDIDPDGAMFAAGQHHGFFYDEADDSVIFTVGTNLDIAHASGDFIFKWSEASGIVWVTKLPSGVPSGISGQSRLSGGYIGFWTFTDAVQISTATGAITYKQPHGINGWPIGTLNTIQVYDSETQIVLAYWNGGGSGAVPGGFAKAFLNRGDSAGTTLGGIISDQCLRSGFAPADFDVAELTDVVQGYVVSQRATAADVMTPLLGGYLVDAVESDYVLKFRHRGHALVAAVQQEDLIRMEGQNGQPYVETRQQEIELPMRLTLTYADKDRDYMPNTAIAKRIRVPNPTVHSDNQIDAQLAAVMTSTPAKQMAERILYSAWNERHSFSARLSPEFDYLDPGDAVQLTLADGYTARVRLGQTSLGVDYSLDTKLIGETDGQYISTAEADIGVPWIGSHFIFAAGKSELILLDTPLLRDVDDMGGIAVRGYWAGGPFSRTALWPGAVLQASQTTNLWANVTAANTEATWGYVDNAPDDWPPIFATQDELHGGVMTVGIIGGHFTPSSVTDFDLANFENPLALIKTNGQVEIIQYRDATPLGDGLWQLSTLRRGQRGTDTMAFGHEDGEIAVFLGEELVQGLEIPLSQRNISEFWRLVTVGMVPDDALIESFTYHGRDQMPYAPVNARRSNSGSDGILTWTRRTRIGGMLEDGTDSVPLHEASEAYEVYLLPNEAAATSFDPTNPATYRRAFLGLTSPTLTYTAAQMAADGFTPATDTVYAAIYQVSAVVGRGFSSLHVLPPLGPLTVALEDGTGDWDGWTWG
jgi:hypothetical protein